MVKFMKVHCALADRTLVLRECVIAALGHLEHMLTS